MSRNPNDRAPSLEQLVAKITPENRHDEIDWGPPVGGAAMTIDPRRSREISIAWNDSNLIGRITVGGEYWAAVEWSQKRQCWCIEDAEGRCLTHQGSIQGTAASKGAAVTLAEEMIRDGRMPAPEEAYEAHQERRRLEREKRARQPAVQRRRAATKQRQEERWRAYQAEHQAERREESAPPLHELLHEVFNFADAELWKSNSFAALRPRLTIHLERVVAQIEREEMSTRHALATAKVRYRGWAERRLAEIAPRLAKAREILELLKSGS